MPLRVTLDLTDQDLDHFSHMAIQAQERAHGCPESEVVAAASELLSSVRESPASDFIKQRLGQLEELTAMLSDAGFAMPEDDRQRVVTALAYFNEPDDLIPDSVPGLGFLDDAIMVELMCRELRHEIDAYRDFCRFRASEAKRRGVDPESLGRAEFLENRRLQLISRMRRRRHRDFSSPRGARSPFSLF